MSDIDDELNDSFTQQMIRRNQERRRLLEDSSAIGLSDTFDCDSDDNESQLSINSLEQCVKSVSEVTPNVLRSDSQVNVKLNSSSEEVEDEAPIDPKTQQVMQNLAKLESERRVTLSQRLNSLARNYGDTENLDFIDSDSNEIPMSRVRSPTKTMRQALPPQNDSPPKKRLLLNERLNMLAKTYDDSEHSEIKSPKKQMDKSDFVSPKKRMINVITKSPMRPIVEPEKKIAIPKTFSNSSIPTPPPPPKIESPKKSVDDGKRSPAASIIELQKRFMNNNTESNNCSTISVPSLPSPKILNNSPFAEKAKSPIRSTQSARPPPFRSGASVGHTVGRQIQDMKRTSNDPATASAAKTPKVVSNRISRMKELFEEKLAPYVTNTATMYQQEVERRRMEVEMLKRQEFSLPEPQPSSCSPDKKSLSVDESKEQMNKHEESQESVDDNVLEQNNEMVASRESIDNETAQQTVCDAFKDIEDYSEAEEEMNENLNFGIDSRISESKLIIDKKLNMSPTKSPTKNRLYPDLNIDENEEIDPPTKPPRLFLDSNPKPTNTTPMRTISFYRKNQAQQNQNSTQTVVCTTPKRSVNDQNNMDFEQRKRKIQDKILEMQRGIDDSARIAGQASQALNLCLETDEFKGSAERVEAEKLLLFSAQKRLAFTNEIPRLKTQLIDFKPETPTTKGTLTVRDLRLKIRTDFMVNKLKGNISETHHFVCIISNGPNLFTTNVVSTDKLEKTDDVSDTYLEFHFGVSLNELSSAFSVHIQVYDLVTRNRELPHELKYHIKKTPKKNKLTMKSPKVQSPGGPNAVLTTSFKLVGRVVITLSNYHMKRFTMESFQFESPLEGTLNVLSELKVSHGFRKEGFFDLRDSSGVYTMRYGVLKGHHLAFYRFPEDIESKSPLMKIDLKHVINPTITMLPSHLQQMVRCNTLALITIDPRHDSVGIFSKGGSLPRNPPKKYLISDESREYTTEWAKELSKALESIRIWSGDAVKPFSNEEFERLFVALN